MKDDVQDLAPEEGGKPDDMEDPKVSKVNPAPENPDPEGDAELANIM